MYSYFPLDVELEYLGAVKSPALTQKLFGSCPLGQSHPRSSVHTWNTSMKCRGNAGSVAAGSSCFVPFSLSFLIAVLSVCCDSLPCVVRIHKLHGFPAGLV